MSSDRSTEQALLAVYTFLILFFSLTPLTHTAGGGISGLFTRFPSPAGWTDFWLNLMAYVPWGFLLARTMGPKFKERRDVLPFTALCALLLSLGVESSQIYIATRVPALHDLLLNLGGALLGAFLAINFTVHE